MNGFSIFSIFILFLFSFCPYFEENTLQRNGLKKFNPGLPKPGLKTFEQSKFKPGLVKPEIKLGLG